MGSAATRTTEKSNNDKRFEESVVDVAWNDFTKPSKINGSAKTEKTRAVTGTERVVDFVAGAVGLEPTTNGFGDHYSTN